ncbi:MAG: hypothetical protein GC160_12055 [Acidobacteria bacterium]|nr:hypothetical protein [Acidobacteriota bacterium]
MRETCSGCGETFLDENITECGACGRTLCYHCLGPHQQQTGHREPDPRSLRGRFNADVRQRLETYLRLQFGPGLNFLTATTEGEGVTFYFDLKRVRPERKACSVRIPTEALLEGPWAELTGWPLGDVLGEALTRYLVEEVGLAASGERIGW